MSIIIRLCPARLFKQLWQQIPVLVEILVTFVTLLFPQDMVILVPIGEDGIVKPFLRIMIRLERDGTTVQVGVVAHNLVGIQDHGFRIVDVAQDKPLQIVGSQFDILHDAADTKCRVVQHLDRPVRSLTFDGDIRAVEEIAQCPEEQQPRPQYNPRACAHGQGITKSVQFHGSRSSIVILRRSMPFLNISSEAASTISGRRRNSLSPESFATWRRRISSSISF